MSRKLTWSVIYVVVFTHCTLSHNAVAQPKTVAFATAGNSVDAKIKAFLEPESGLNNEIRAGLARLEQTCTFTNKSKQATPGPLFSKSALITKEISSARSLAQEQQSVVDKAIAEFRANRGLNMNACAALPSLLRVSEQCVRYQNDTALAQAVSEASQLYYAETFARFKSYEDAIDLEARGCTRPDFAHKLWSAEQAHIVPKLKTSGQQLSDLLK